MKKKYRVYVATPIRGEKGNAATFEEMQKNCDIARTGLTWLEENFPWVEFFCPAVNDRIVQRLVGKGYVTVEQVLECDHEEQLLCRAIVAFTWEASGGVLKEMELAHENNQPVYTIKTPNDLEELSDQLFTFFAYMR